MVGLVLSCFVKGYVFLQVMLGTGVPEAVDVHACVEVVEEDDEEDAVLAWVVAVRKEERKLQKRMRSISSLRHSLMVSGRVANEEERLKLASEAGTLERLQAVMRHLGISAVVNCPEVPIPVLDGCMHV